MTKCSISSNFTAPCKQADLVFGVPQKCASLHAPTGMCARSSFPRNQPVHGSPPPHTGIRRESTLFTVISANPAATLLYYRRTFAAFKPGNYVAEKCKRRRRIRRRSGVFVTEQRPCRAASLPSADRSVPRWWWGGEPELRVFFSPKGR